MSPILTLALDLALTLALSLIITTTLTIIAAQHALTSAAAKIRLPLTLNQLPHLLYHSHHDHSYCQTRILLVSLTLTLSSILVVLTLTLALTLTLTLTFQEPAEVPLEGGASPYEVDRVIIRVSGNCSLTVGI